MTGFMEGADKRYVIPVYQRKYDWKRENCSQLYEDLKKIIFDKRESHFFGSIVSSVVPNGSKIEYHIIDGQQRLTTLQLLLDALHAELTVRDWAPIAGQVVDLVEHLTMLGGDDGAGAQGRARFDRPDERGHLDCFRPCAENSKDSGGHARTPGQENHGDRLGEAGFSHQCRCG